MHPELPIPAHYDPEKAGEVWKTPYEQRAVEAQDWARQHNLKPVAEDLFKVCLIAVDMQNTFCTPGFELYVGGRSGTGAVDDSRRLTEFVYRNLGNLSEISATLDTHQAIQIFHALYLVNDQGEHPSPLTLVSVEDVEQGRWKFNPAVAGSLGISPEYGQEHLLHYTRQLKGLGKYELTIWPYHAMFGGIGHALVSCFEEATFFHTVARVSQPDFVVKGSNPLSESYSAVGPEVRQGPDGRQIGKKSSQLYEKLVKFDAVVIAGEAKSHCVAWTIDDLLTDMQGQDASLVSKVYLLEDCTSPVVVPGVVDYTDEADAAFERFARAGLNVVRSTEPIESWPGIRARARG